MAVAITIYVNKLKIKLQINSKSKFLCNMFCGTKATEPKLGMPKHISAMFRLKKTVSEF
jgi:hypothetical protein